MRCINFFAQVVGEIEIRGGATRTEHAVVHGLDHPTDLLSKVQFTKRGEGEVLKVKRGGVDSGIVDIQSSHVVVGIGLQEHSPCRCGGCAAVRPSKRGGSVGHQGMRRGIPNDGPVGRPGVDTTHGWRSDQAIFPGEREVRSFRSASFGGGEGDQIRREVGRVEHDRHVILSVGKRRLHGFGDVKGHPIVADAVHQVNKATNVGANSTATAGRPVVHAVVGRGVGRRCPTLQHGTGGDGFAGYRAVF